MSVKTQNAVPRLKKKVGIRMKVSVRSAPSMPNVSSVDTYPNLRHYDARKYKC